MVFDPVRKYRWLVSMSEPCETYTRSRLDQACPGAVEMELRTPYELKIPRDSVAYTTNAGVFGPTYLEIDVQGASGPPVQSGGQLPSRESMKLTGVTVDRVLKAVELVKQLSDEEKEGRAQPPRSRPGAKPSPEPSLPK